MTFAVNAKVVCNELFKLRFWHIYLLGNSMELGMRKNGKGETVKRTILVTARESVKSLNI